MSLKQKTISGIGWAATARIVRQILQFVIMIVLVRLLTPDDFGLVGMIVVFTGFAGLFGEAGFGSALVQAKEIEERHCSSVYWVTIVTGILIALLTVLFAPIISRFYGEPRLTLLMSVIALNFVLVSFGVVQASLFKRSMDFMMLTIIEVAAILMSGSVAIGLALSGFGVWSLVAELLVASASTAVALWLLSTWKPRFLFDLSAVRDLIGFSGNLLGFNAINYWVRNADNLLIGKVVGSSGLGIYSRAYAIMLMPMRLASTIGSVMFPTLSVIQQDRERVKRIFLLANRAIALIVIPLMCGLFVVADSFVMALFGPQWEALTPVLRILCFVGVKQPLDSTVGWIFLSQGRTDLQFRWGLFSGAFVLVAFVIGVQWGVIGVAVAYAVSSYALWYPLIAIPGRLIDLGFREFIRNVAGILGCALAMAGTIWLISLILPSEWPRWLVLLLLTTSGVAWYWVLLQIFNPNGYRDVRRLIGEQRSRYVAGVGIPGE